MLRNCSTSHTNAARSRRCSTAAAPRRFTVSIAASCPTSPRSLIPRAPTIEPFDVRTLIHGELTFENVLWDHDEITALDRLRVGPTSTPRPRTRRAVALLHVLVPPCRERLRGAHSERSRTRRCRRGWRRTIQNSSPSAALARSIADLSRSRSKCAGSPCFRGQQQHVSGQLAILFLASCNCSRACSHLDLNGVNRVLPG